MKPTRLLILALLTLGLFSFIYFYERKKPSTEELRERQGKLFPDLVTDEVSYVTVHSRSGQFEFTKEGGTWQLIKPLKDDAEQGAVSSLLAQLARLKAERTFAASEIKLADFGLEKPEKWVEVKDKKGKTYRLTLGQELPLGNNLPVITDGRQVYLVSKWISSDVDKDLSGWRSKNLLPFTTMDINAVTLVSPQGRVAAARSGNLWTLTEPLSDLADKDAIEGVLSDVAAARIKEFLDEGGDPRVLGLETPRVTITLVRKQESPVTLAFGVERDQSGSKEVACRRGERMFWVEASAISRLGKQPQEFRSAKLMPFSTWQVDKLVLERGAVKVTVERKEGVWRGNKGEEVDSGPIFARLSALADLQVLAFDQPTPQGEPLGSANVQGQEGLAFQVSFYPASQKERVLAVVKGRPKALAVDRTKVEEVLAGVEELGKPKPTPSPTAPSKP